MISDIIREAKTKMANAIEYAKEEFAAIRTDGRTPRCSPSSRRVLRHPDSAATARHLPRARRPGRIDHALRPHGDGRDREIHPRFRPGGQPIE